MHVHLDLQQLVQYRPDEMSEVTVAESIIHTTLRYQAGVRVTCFVDVVPWREFIGRPSGMHSRPTASEARFICIWCVRLTQTDKSQA